MMGACKHRRDRLNPQLRICCLPGGQKEQHLEQQFIAVGTAWYKQPNDSKKLTPQSKAKGLPLHIETAPYHFTV